MCAAASIALLCSLGVLVPGMARGQAFDAPALVTADETGAFCYDATFTAGPGGFDVMLIVIDGFDNTDISEFFDEPFCSLSLAEGQTYSFSFPAPHCPDGIGGSLLDLMAEGSVSVSLSNAFGDLTCRGDEVQSFGGHTTVLPFQSLICFDNSVCALGRYCEKLDGCDQGGTCADRPTSCPPPPPPGVVCGCDDVNYDSVCEAARRGVSVDFAGGPCLTATPTPTATPTATATPAPSDCLCVPTNVVPAGNLVALTNVGNGGKGSAQSRSVSVILEAQDVTRNSCKTGDHSNPVAVTLRMVDDDDDVILDASKGGIVCTGGESTSVKFTARYDVTHCKGSATPVNTSKGKVEVTATSGEGSLTVTRKVHCKR